MQQRDDVSTLDFYCTTQQYAWLYVPFKCPYARAWLPVKELQSCTGLGGQLCQAIHTSYSLKCCLAPCRSQAAAAEAAQCTLFPEGTEGAFKVSEAPGPEEVCNISCHYKAVAVSVAWGGSRRVTRASQFATETNIIIGQSLQRRPELCSYNYKLVDIGLVIPQYFSRPI